jgi:serine protease Do
VEPGGPAAQAGLQPGDVVLAVNATPVSDSADLLTTVARVRPGGQVDLLVWRSNTATHMTVTVGAMDANGAAPAATQTPSRLGVTVRPLTPQEQQKVGVDHGLLVQQVTGRAASVGLKPGDIVLSVNETPVATIDQLAEALRLARGNAALLIQRGTSRQYVPIDLG